MDTETFTSHLSRREADIGRLGSIVIDHPEHVADLIDGLESEEATVRFNSSKVLLDVANRAPAVVYPDCRTFVHLLDHDNSFLRAAAIRTLSRLAAVDHKGLVTRALKRVVAPIPGPDLMIAAESISGAARIARAKPQLTNRVVEAILCVDYGRYRTTECGHIAVGKAIQALDTLYERTPARIRGATDAFVRKHLENPRNATRRKAEQFARRRLRMASDVRDGRRAEG